jgi:hypothetical protein
LAVCKSPCRQIARGLMADEYAIQDAPQPWQRESRKYAAPTPEEICKWIAFTPSARVKALLVILLHIDTGIAEAHSV